MCSLFIFNFKKMRKAIGYIVLIICLTIYIVSSDQELTRKVFSYKMKFGSLISTDKYKYGDLYGMSYLSYFRKHYHVEDKVKSATCNYQHKIDLYAVCDSYIWPFFDSSKYYCGVDRLTFIRTNFREKLTLLCQISSLNFFRDETLTGKGIYVN